MYHSFLPTVCQHITTTIDGRLFPTFTMLLIQYSVFMKWFKVTTYCWYLYILNGMLYYNSWTILKPIHYHLAPDFNTDTRILHTILQPGRHRHDTFCKKWRGIMAKALYVEFVFPFDQAFMVLISWYAQNVFNRLRLSCCIRLAFKISWNYFTLHGWALEQCEVYVEICH